MAPPHITARQNVRSKNKRESPKAIPLIMRAGKVMKGSTCKRTTIISASLKDKTVDGMTFPLFQNLPKEIRLRIYQEMFGPDPAVLYVSVDISPNSHTRIIYGQGKYRHLAKRTWAQQVAEQVPEMWPAFEERFGTQAAVWETPENAAKPQDLVVYIPQGPELVWTVVGYHALPLPFAPNIWKFHMCRHRANVGICWDKKGGKNLQCRTREVACGIPGSQRYHDDNLRLCPESTARFLQLFASLRHVYIQALFSKVDMIPRVAKKIDPQDLAQKWIDEARKNRGQAIFEDSTRTWVEIDQRIAWQYFDGAFLKVFNLSTRVRKRYQDQVLHPWAQIKSKPRRMEVQFHIIVAPLHKKAPKRGAAKSK